MSLVRPRIQPYIYRITPFELTVKDKYWLDKAVEKDYHKTSVDKILIDAVNGLCQLWRFNSGIIVSEIILFGENKYLWLTQMAGEGFIKNLDKISSAMTKYREETGCIHFEVATAEKGLQKIFSKRFKEITRVYAEIL